MTPVNNTQGDPKEGARRIASYGFTLFLALYIIFDLGIIFHFASWLEIVLVTLITIFGVAFSTYLVLSKNISLYRKISLIFALLYFMIKSLYSIITA